MKCLFFAIALFVTIPAYESYTQSNFSKTKQEQNDTINWLSLDEAMDLIEIERKKIFIDIYTASCEECLLMDNTTFGDPAIAKYMNDNFYAVKFNAEQQEAITFRDKTYEFVNSGDKGYHELAFEITKGRLSYPSFVFLDQDLEVIQPIPGFKKSEVFEMIMTYFGNDNHTTIPWSKYQEEYVPLKTGSND